MSAALQIFITINLNYQPVSDLLYIDEAARNIAKYGFDNMQVGPVFVKHKLYFLHFPNNWAILFFVSFIYKIIFSIFGSIPDFIAPIMGIICTLISQIMLFKCAKLIFRDRPRRIFTAVFTVALPVFPLYSQIFYTDTFSMPFVISAVYYFIAAFKTQDKKHFFIRIFLSALLVGIGYTIKGSAAILLVAFVMTAFLKRDIFKGTVTLLVTAMMIFACNTAVLRLGLDLGVATAQQLETNRFPTIHWVMMGMVGNGGFNKQEHEYTKEVKGYDNKIEADKERIVQHLESYSSRGFCDHIVEKAAFTWNSGKYYAVHHFEGSPPSRLHWIIEKSRSFRLYCDGIHISMLMLMLISMIKGLTEKRIDPIFVLRLSAFGLALFLLIWEARSRYLVNFTPIFVLLSADGLGTLSGLCMRSFGRSKWRNC